MMFRYVLLLVVALNIQFGIATMADEGGEYFLALEEALKGGVVNEESVATGIAELIVGNSFGKEELDLQSPFEAKEEADHWLVEGSHSDPIRLTIMKRDARITNISHASTSLRPPDWVRQIIKEKVKKK